jgi:uncharacterized protein (DUF58 family)
MAGRWALPGEGVVWLLVAGGLIFLAWWRGVSLVLLLGYLLFALFVFNAGAAGRGLGRVRAARKTAGTVFAGQSAFWEVELSHDGPRPLQGLRVGEHGKPGWFVPLLDADRPLSLRVKQLFPSRGRHRGGPLAASCRFPFGLFQRNAQLDEGADQLVLPRLGRMSQDRLHQWLMHAVRGDGRAHISARPTRDQEAELHGLRPFRFGDSPRWIHWRTTARRNELIVREFEQDLGLHDILVVVEPWLATPAALEAAISLAATVCWGWCHHSGQRLALAVAGPTPVVLAGGIGPGQARLALECLAVQAGSVDTDASPGRLVQALAGLSPRTTVLLVTSWRGSRLESALADGLDRPVAVLDASATHPFYTPPVTDEEEAPGPS